IDRMTGSTADGQRRASSDGLDFDDAWAEFSPPDPGSGAGPGRGATDLQERVDADADFDEPAFDDGGVEEQSRETQVAFSECDALDDALRAGVIFRVSWGEAEPDLEDERYRRCLAAAGRALAGLWEADSPVVPGEPIGPPAAALDVFTEVDGFAFSKIGL